MCGSDEARRMARNCPTPLLIVDGKRTDWDDGLDFNPGDIETVDVIKGAAAFAKYGAAARDGVVMVTTRKPARP